MTNKEKEGVKSSIKAVGFVLSAILIFSFCFLIGTVIRARLQSNAATVEDGERVAEDTDLTYYLKVKYDGIDRVGTESSDYRIAGITSDVVSVSDKIPDGLTFSSFATTSTGSIGAVKRIDNTSSCPGYVIDDTGSTTGWNAGNTEYVYHGLHYDAASRTVSFRVKNLMAGCQLTVGIVTRTPILPTGVLRMDFYNTAGFIENDLSGNSNTSHTFIGKKEATTYQVLYEYTGTVPDGAPAAPSETRYIEGATVGVERGPEMNGYDFSGWSTSDVTVTNGQFTMPTNTVTFRGSYTAKPTYTLSYSVTGDTPEGYHAPNSRSYGEGDVVMIDSFASGDVIDGYRFSGWSTSDATISDGSISMPAGNVTLTGSFTKIDYAVSYQFQGSDMPSGAGSLLPATTRHYPGDTVTTAAKPTASGYEFLGWNMNNSFKMPEEDVVIYGEWREVPGTFRLSIAQAITNPKDEYRVTETVKFKITVTNPGDFPINDINVGLNLPGAAFTEDSAYTKRAEQLAIVSTLAAGASVDLYAEFPVTEDLTKTYTSVAKILNAAANNNYVLDMSDEALAGYEASVSFNTLSWNDIPVLTGVNMGNMLPFVALVILGAVGGFMTVLSHVKKSKVAKREVIVPARNSRKRVARIIIPTFLVTVLTLGLFVIGNGVFADKQPIRTIELTSQNTSYSNGVPGAWKVEKSAEWTGPHKVRITFDVDSILKRDNRDKDLLLVLDGSSTMSDFSWMKTDMINFVEEFMSSGNNKVALITINGSATIASGFTDNDAIITNAIDSFERGGDTSYYDAILKAEEVFQDYQASSNRDAMMLFLSDGYNKNDIRREESEYIYFKDIHPYVTSYGIDYNIFCDEDFVVSESIVHVSDKQSCANSSTLSNVIVPLFGSIAYDDFIITDYIEGSSFDSVIKVDSSIGEAIISSDGNTPVVTWDMSNSYYSGARAKLTIDVRLKSDISDTHAKVFETNEREIMTSSLSGVPDESFTSTSSPLLQLWFDVVYDANLPTGCAVSGTIPATAGYIPYDTVEISSNRPYCEGYTFKGWSIDDGIKKVNDDYFVMPLKDVTLKGVWGKVSIDKSMDGTIRTIKDAILDQGIFVNTKLKSLANPGISYSADDPDRNVTEIRYSDSLPIGFVPSSANTISVPGSPEAVYAYYDNGIIYIYTNANSIIMNADSSVLFSNFYNLSTFDIIADWDASNVENMSGMFRNTGFYDTNLLSSWSVSNVEDMSEMFYYTDISSLGGLSSWNTLNVEDMSHMFEWSGGITDLGGIGGWNTSSVTDMYYMFGRTKIADIDDLSEWNTSSVTNMSYMFYNTSLLENVNGALNWNTSSVKDMSYMFSGTSKLDDISGLAKWNTSSVEDMSGMFQKTYAIDFDVLETTQRSGYVSWDTSSVKDMSYMFNDISSRASADISGIAKWNTSSVTNMSHMFDSVARLDDYSALSTTQRSGYKSWDVSSVEDMSYMFYSNVFVTNIDPLIEWDTSSVKDMNNMFRQALALTNINGALNWDTSSVEDMSYMFYATKIENLDGATRWTTTNVKNMSYMFAHANKLANIDGAASWQNTSLENASYMFYEDVVLVNLGNASGLITSSTTNTSYMFFNNKLLENINGALGWNTSGVLDMSYMFAGCPKLANINGALNWDVSSVKNMQYMFASASSLADISGAINWRPSSALSMSNMFVSNSSLTNIDALIDWDTSNVNDMSHMFANSPKLEDIDGAENWNTGSVTDMSFMFVSCSKLANIDGASNWNTSSVNDMSNMFASDSSLASVAGAAKWNVSSVTNMKYMFAGDNNIPDLSPLETTQRSGYKSWEPASSADMSAMFGGIPSSVTRPSWAPPSAA